MTNERMEKKNHHVLQKANFILIQIITQRLKFKVKYKVIRKERKFKVKVKKVTPQTTITVSHHS